MSLCALALSACGGDDEPTQAVARVDDYIRSERFDGLIVEVDAVPGLEPRSSVATSLEITLEAVLDKPAGVRIAVDDALEARGSDHAWTESELFALADERFDDAGGAGEVSMHVMFVDGHSASDDGSRRVLGLAWKNTHMALFAETIADACAAAGPLFEEQLCSAAEEAIWLHEIGHTLGLVENGLPMVEDHRDPEHGAHDVNDECVMYFAYDGTAGIDQLAQIVSGGGGAPGFDDACLADIAALRAR